MRSKRLRILGIATAVALGAACGNDTGMTDTGTPTTDGGTDGGSDAGPDGSADGGTDGGADGGTEAACTEADLNKIMVFTTASDFSNASFSYIDLTDLSQSDLGDGSDGTDWAPGQAGCQGYLMDRTNGLIGMLDVDDPFTPDNVLNVNPGGSEDPYLSNPQKLISVGPSRGYVVQLARNVITVVDPSLSGATAVLGEIDLSGFVKPGDMDGNVDAVDGIVVGDRAYIALAHYWFDSDFGVHFEGSELAVIDITTDTIVDADPAADGVQNIALQGDNPWRGLVYVEATGKLWVGSAGDGFANDGFIETVDLTTMVAEGTIVTEAELDGEIKGFARHSATRVLLIVDTDLVAIDPSVDFTTPDQIASDMEGLLLHQGTLWAWAREGDDPGLASFDPVSGDETTPAAGRFAFGDLLVYAAAAIP